MDNKPKRNAHLVLFTNGTEYIIQQLKRIQGALLAAESVSK